MKREEIFIRLPQGVPEGVGERDDSPEGDCVFGWADTRMREDPVAGAFYSFDRDGRVQTYVLDARGNLALAQWPQAVPAAARLNQPRIQVPVVPFHPPSRSARFLSAAWKAFRAPCLTAAVLYLGLVVCRAAFDLLRWAVR